MSTFPYCPYMFSVVIISEYSGQITKTKTSSDKKRSVLMFLCWTVVSGMFLFCSFFCIVFYLKNHIFSFNYMILCIKYLVIFIDFMCYVSITVLYSFSYFQAMLVAIDTMKFCYSLFPRRLFHLSCNKY